MNKTRRTRRQKLTICRHARTRPKWVCGSAAWVGNEPRHKTRRIRGFILFHSILHGRQPPREYGIKLLRRLTEDDEIEAAEKISTPVVDIGKFPRPRMGGGRSRAPGRHIPHNQVAGTRCDKVSPAPDTYACAYFVCVSRVRRAEFDVIALRMPPIRATTP